MSFITSTEHFAEKIHALFESKKTHCYIIFLVILNALVMGLSYIPFFKTHYGPVLEGIDHVIVTISLIELSTRILALRARFFKNYWNVFDLVVTIISLSPPHFALAPLRLLRALHSLKLLELLPKTKHVIDGLAHSFMGIINVVLIGFVFFYVFSITGTELFSSLDSQHFGDLTITMKTLFKFMANPEWPMTDKVLNAMPHAFVFFILFIFVISYFALNFIVGVVVGAMSKAEEENEDQSSLRKKGPSKPDMEQLMAQINLLQADIKSLRHVLNITQNKK